MRGSQGLALLMGRSTPDLLFTSGMENPTSTPVLCKSLAMLLDGLRGMVEPQG